MKSVKEFLWFLWIVLIPFQDTSLQALPIGFLGASPSFIPLALLLFITLLEWLSRGDGLRVNRALVFIIGYVILVNALYLMLFGTQSHGTNLFFKSFNLSILTGLLVLPIFFLDYDSLSLPKHLFAAFFVTIFGVILGDILALPFLGDNTFLHFHENLSLRPRGFSLESSTLGATAVTLGLLSAYYAKSGLTRMLFALASVGIALYSYSKGAIVILLVTAGLLVITGRKIRVWPKLALTGVILVVIYASMALVTRQFVYDIDLYTSSATRSGLAATALITVTRNPLGVGFSGFLPAIDRYTPEGIALLDNVTGGVFNFAELSSYIGADSDINISTKTFLFDNLFYFGIPFLILFALFHKRLFSALNRSGSTYLFAAVVFSLIALCTYVGGLGQFNFTLVYGIAYYEIFRKKDISRLA